MKDCRSKRYRFFIETNDLVEDQPAVFKISSICTHADLALEVAADLALSFE